METPLYVRLPFLDEQLMRCTFAILHPNSFSTELPSKLDCSVRLQDCAASPIHIVVRRLRNNRGVLGEVGKRSSSSYRVRILEQEFLGGSGALAP